MIVSEGAVIGIDVGWSPTRRSSAICLFSWTTSTVSWKIARFRAAEPEREAAIADIVGGRHIVAAAFDGPIRRGFDIIGRYRTAERMLTRRLRPLIGKPGQSSSPVGRLLNHHANECVRHVVSHGTVHAACHGVAIDRSALVEAFPSAFLGLMIKNPADLSARRADRSDTFFAHLTATGDLSALIQHCIPGRHLASNAAHITNHDDRAAFVCALTALSVVAGDFVAVGDQVDGWIILPPRQFIQHTQWELLELNASEQETSAFYIAEGPDALEKLVVPLR